MNIDLSRLNSNIDKKININDTITYTKDDFKGTDIISMEPVKLNGYICKNSLNNYEIHVSVNGKMMLPCAITLKPVPYEFNLKIDENLDEFGEFSEKSKNMLDISPIIWENILVDVPMKVVSQDFSNSKLEGDGWRFITTDMDNAVINPELEKLKDLL